MFFAFMLGAVAMLIVGVAFPETFTKMVEWIRSLIAKVANNDEDENGGDDFSVK